MSNELSPPRTIDAIGIVKAKLGQYPAGALSPREVVTTLPLTDEASFQRIDAALTGAIFKAAAEKRDVTNAELIDAACGKPRQSLRSFIKR